MRARSRGRLAGHLGDRHEAIALRGEPLEGRLRRGDGAGAVGRRLLVRAVVEQDHVAVLGTRAAAGELLDGRGAPPVIRGDRPGDRHVPLLVEGA